MAFILSKFDCLLFSISLSVSLSRFLPSLVPLPHSALDLLSQLLTFDPARRITAQQALRHPFFARAGGQLEFNAALVAASQREPMPNAFEEMPVTHANMMAKLHEELEYFRQKRVHQ